MSRVIRLLVYEGSDADLQVQLGCSMNDGERRGSGSVRIRAITLPPSFEQLLTRIATELISDVVGDEEQP